MFFYKDVGKSFHIYGLTSSKLMSLKLLFPIHPLHFTLVLVIIPFLVARRLDHHSKRFFRNICLTNSCLYHLLPPPWDPAVTAHLCKPTVYLRTKSSRTFFFKFLVICMHVQSHFRLQCVFLHCECCLCFMCACWCVHVSSRLGTRPTVVCRVL